MNSTLRCHGLNEKQSKNVRGSEETEKDIHIYSGAVKIRELKDEHLQYYRKTSERTLKVGKK